MNKMQHFKELNTKRSSFFYACKSVDCLTRFIVNSCCELAITCIMAYTTQSIKAKIQAMTKCIGSFSYRIYGDFFFLLNEVAVFT